MVLCAAIAISLVEPVAAQSKPHPVTADSTASAPKQHQATGDVATSASTQLVILKQFGRNKVRWTFVTNPKTKLDGKAAKGAHVRIFYHEEKGQRVADRVKIMEAAPESSTAAATASSSTSRSVACIPIGSAIRFAVKDTRGEVNHAQANHHEGSCAQHSHTGPVRDEDNRVEHGGAESDDDLESFAPAAG